MQIILNMYRYTFLLLLLMLLCNAQNHDILSLEKEVIRLNRLGRQKESHEKITMMLAGDISDEESVKLNLLLANTFRSINDYSSAIYYLKNARHFADVNTVHDSLKTALDAELAFSTFDNNDYAASEKIIIRLRNGGYKYLSNESRAYIIMQDGYIKFLAKNYRYAEECFNESLDILKRYSSCNQPAVMVKQIQLYAAMKNTDKAQEIYEKCIYLSQKCKILKYKIYATEELSKVYRESNNKDRFFYYTKLLDSLKLIDRQEQRLSIMHASNQDYMYKENTEQIMEKKIYLFFSIIMVLCSCILFIILRRKARKKARQYEDLISKIRISSEHTVYNADSPHKEIESRLRSLNKKQKDIVGLALQGLTNREIAEKLCVSEATIKYHFTNIFEILQIKNRKDLFKIFISPNNLS